MTVVALLLIIGSLLIRWQRYFSRQKRDDAPIVQTQRPTRTDGSHYQGAPEDVARWQVAMHETARELSAQLDSKMGALQALIADADKAATRLEAAAAQSPEPTAGGPSPESTTPPPKTLTTNADEESLSQHRREEVYTLADYGFDLVEIARRVDCLISEVELILSLRGKQ